jgi:hypothetical protein
MHRSTDISALLKTGLCNRLHLKSPATFRDLVQGIFFNWFLAFRRHSAIHLGRSATSHTGFISAPLSSTI